MLKEKDTNVVSKVLLMTGLNQKQLAESLGLEQAISITLFKKSNSFPAKHCARIKLICRGKVQLHELNPVAFPVPDDVLLSCSEPFSIKTLSSGKSAVITGPVLSADKQAA